MYARMLLGYSANVGTLESRVEYDLHYALERLSKFTFVGLTEELDRSICLFHQKLGGSPFGAEFVVNRAGLNLQEVILQEIESGRYATVRSKQFDTDTIALIITTEQNQTGEFDWIDEALYSQGQLMFWKDVANYGGEKKIPTYVRTHEIEASRSFFVGKYDGDKAVHAVQTVPTNSKHVAVVMGGEMARGKNNCSKEAIETQYIATLSQRRTIFNPLNLMGWKVDIFLATNDCPELSTWQSDIRSGYSPWLKALRIGSCILDKEHRCLQFRSIELLRKHHRFLSTGDDKYAVIFMTRPDLKISERGGQLIQSMIPKGIVNFVWPFYCQEKSFTGCVADMFLAIPNDLFDLFYENCLGHVGCHPSAYGDGFFNRHFADEPQNFKAFHSGHLCKFCVKRKMIRTKMLSSTGRPIRLEFEKESMLHTDSRKYPNPFYEMPPE
jgi:hypothetical protein